MSASNILSHHRFRANLCLFGFGLRRGCGGVLALVAVTGCQGELPDADTTTETTVETSPTTTTDPDMTTTEASSDTDSGSTPLDPMTSLYPLVVGASWVYTSSYDGAAEEEVRVEAADPAMWGDNAFYLIDNPDEAGEWTSSVIRRTGTAALRVHKQVNVGETPTLVVDYDPGFMRADDAWAAAAPGHAVELQYTRIATDNGKKPEVRGHRYTVVAVDEMVTVPAGDFPCVHIQRERLTGMTKGEIVDLWYSPGVGKVKEHRPAEGRYEFLLRYAIPGAPQP